MPLAARLLSICVLILAACDSPSPAFRNVPAQEITVAGFDFTVRQDGEVFEAIRTNPIPLHKRGMAGMAMVQAVEAVSGCQVYVKGLQVDSAMGRGKLNCG